MRKASFERVTAESAVSVTLDLDDYASCDVTTTSRMFDHLLAQWAFAARCGLRLDAQSRDGIQHHVVEDAAIALGSALDRALGDRAGIERYACRTVPMDDALVRCALDLGGRGYARVALALASERIEDLQSVLIAHAFSSFATAARSGLHLDALAGSDPHHLAEAAFKALGIASRAAWSIDRAMPLRIPSTKDVV